MVDFDSIKSITIPEGNVKKITANGVVLWEKQVAYTNLAIPNDTNTTDWSLWINNTRMGNDGSYRSNATSMVTNFIELIPGEPQKTFYFYGMDIPENGFSSSVVGAGQQVAFFQVGSTGMDKSWIGGLSFADFKSKRSQYLDYTTDENGFVTSMSLGRIWITTADQFYNPPYYFRLNLPNTLDKSKIVITCNEPIVPDNTPFAFDLGHWTFKGGNSNTFTVNSDGISFKKETGNSAWVVCNHEFTRKSGTYTFSCTANGTTSNGYVLVIVQAFDASGNEIKTTGTYVPNHSYTYNSTFEGFAMNTAYASFTFTLSEDIKTFKIKFAPGGSISTGGTFTLSNISLVEP